MNRHTACLLVVLSIISLQVVADRYVLNRKRRALGSGLNLGSSGGLGGISGTVSKGLTGSGGSIFGDSNPFGNGVFSSRPFFGQRKSIFGDGGVFGGGSLFDSSPRFSGVSGGIGGGVGSGNNNVGTTGGITDNGNGGDVEVEVPSTGTDVDPRPATDNRGSGR